MSSEHILCINANRKWTPQTTNVLVYEPNSSRLLKGDASDTNNYRGITLITCFAKLFTNIINDRQHKWALDNDVLIDVQYGFKPNFSTTDAMFALKALIHKQLNNKQKTILLLH